jgi:hypothetical protein
MWNFFFALKLAGYAAASGVPRKGRWTAYEKRVDGFIKKTIEESYARMCRVSGLPLK